jgi:hypothetical protein
MSGSEAAALVVRKVDEYNEFYKTNVQDTSGLNKENSEPNKENKEIINPEQPVNNNEGNIDPMLLKKEFENSDGESKDNGEQNDPLKNVEKAPDVVNPPDKNK